MKIEEFMQRAEACKTTDTFRLLRCLEGNLLFREIARAEAAGNAAILPVSVEYPRPSAVDYYSIEWDEAIAALKATPEYQAALWVVRELLEQEAIESVYERRAARGRAYEARMQEYNRAASDSARWARVLPAILKALGPEVLDREITQGPPKEWKIQE